FDLLNNDTKEVRRLMNNLSNKGHFSLEKKILTRVSKDFDSGAVTDSDTIATINHYYNEREIVLCPHSAIGVRVAKDFIETGETVVSLGTAHPAKFKETVEQALEVSIPIPPALEAIMEKQESVRVIPPNKHKVAEEIRKSFLEEN
ncbi:hypothetical protein N9U70_00960, partial [Paracoccaceae bacterium]|nr:hypothetical protein [Paracoccaceae bacterium]